MKRYLLAMLIFSSAAQAGEVQTLASCKQLSARQAQIALAAISRADIKGADAAAVADVESALIPIAQSDDRKKK